MSSPDPTGQKPVEWGAMDYASWGANTAVWGAGKVVQYGILKPLEIFGSGASILEKYLFGGEEVESDSIPLEEREITHTPENNTIDPEKALKTMQGEKFDLDPTVAALQDKIKRLEQQLRELGATPLTEEDEAIAIEKRVVSPIPEHKESLDKPKLAAESTKRTGQGIQFNKVENEDVESAANTTTASDTAPLGVSDTVVDEFYSPLYDGEDQAEILESLRQTLKDYNVELQTLLSKPPPIQRVTGSARGKGLGGPSNQGNRAGGQPEGRNVTDPDQPLLNRFNINKTTLQERRQALLAMNNELAQFIRTGNSELRDIKGKNTEILNTVLSFEKNRKENVLKLESMRTDLANAKTKYSAFTKLIDDYENLQKTDPEAASKVRIKFSNQLGKGEVKVVYQSMQQVIDKELIKGYEEDTVRNEDNIKNLIKSMNMDKQKFTGKVYEQELKYVSKTNTPEGEVQENKNITVENVLLLEKNIRVAEEKLKLIRDNMTVYQVRAPKQAAAVVVEEQNADQKELEAKLQKEKLEKMKLEMQEKIGALKPGNVADYSFELASDD